MNEKTAIRFGVEQVERSAGGAGRRMDVVGPGLSQGGGALRKGIWGAAQRARVAVVLAGSVCALAFGAAVQSCADGEGNWGRCPEPAGAVRCSDGGSVAAK